MISVRAGIAVAVAGALGACTSTGTRPSPVQAEAIEVRNVAAGRDEAFRAVAGVMLDRGMMVTLSDHSAGIIGGATWAGSPYAQHTHTPDSLNGPDAVTVWVRPASARESILRIQFAYGGSPRRDAAAVSRFATDVSERLMMAPLARGTP